VSGGGSATTFAYNGDGTRVGKAMNATLTSYAQDLGAGLPVVLTEKTGGQETLYVYGLDLIARVQPGGNHTYYHADALGSTRALTDGSGSVAGTYTYDAFGAVRSQTGGSGNSFTFTGEQADADTGLIFLRARYYDAGTGRLLSADPLGALLALATKNRYVYCLQNPTNVEDPTGLFGWSIGLGGTLGPLVGGVSITANGMPLSTAGTLTVGGHACGHQSSLGGAPPR